MNFEYLVFNLIIITGPVVLSFDRKVAFVKKWKHASISVVISLIPFILWDALVTGRHWRFNDQYTLNFHFFGLPPGEWLFFLTVPFSCLFIWEILLVYMGEKKDHQFPNFVLSIISLLVAVGFFLLGKEYTALVMLALFLIFISDKILKTRVFSRKQIIPFLLILAGLVLVFNGYLTWRPIVIYNDLYNLGFRIFTIPIEDFFYGTTHVALTIVFYEKIKRLKGG